MPLTGQGNLFGRIEPSRQQMEAERSYDFTEDWDWQNPEKLGPQGEQLPVLAEGWRPTGEADFGGGFMGWVKKATSKIQTAYWEGHDEGLQISGIREFAIRKKEGEGAEETLAAIQEKRKPQNEFMADLAGAAEATQEVFNQALWGVLDGLSQPAYWTEQGIGAIAYSIQDAKAGKDVDFENNWKAGRLFYSSLFYDGVREEMQRNIEAGMRTDVAAEEILARSQQDNRKGMMWIELGGQLVADPLNLISIWGKAGKAAVVTAKSTAGYRKATPAAAKLLDFFKDTLRVSDDVARMAAIEDLAKSQEGLRLAGMLVDETVKAGGKLDTWSKTYRLGELTQGGKVAHLSDMTGEMLAHIVNNTESADEALELVRAIVKSTSGNADEAAEGIAGMMRFADPESLFSEAGQNTAVMLSRAVDAYPNWLDDIDAAVKTGGQPKLADLLFSRIDDIGQEMFPPAQKMIEAEKKVALAKKTLRTAELTERDLALANQAKSLPNWVRWHESAQKVVSPINKFFVGAYMGWSPGFAARNFANNTFTIFTDQASILRPSTWDVLFNPAKRLEKVNALHGSDVMRGVESLGKEASLLAESKKSALMGPVLKFNQMIEDMGGRQIVSKSYLTTFRKGMKVAVKEMTGQLRELGLSDEIIRQLPGYIEKAGGDLEKVAEFIGRDIDSGLVNTFADITRIPEKYTGFMDAVPGLREFYVDDVLNAATKDDAIAAWKQVEGMLDEIADTVYQDGVAVVGRDAKVAQEMVAQGLMSEASGSAFIEGMERQRNAFSAVDDVVTEIQNKVTRFLSDAPAQGIEIPADFPGRNLGDLTKFWRGFQDDVFREADFITASAWEVNDKINKIGPEAALDPLYKQFFEGVDITGLNKKAVRDILWPKRRDLVNGVYAADRTGKFEEVKNIMDLLEPFGIDMGDLRLTVDGALESGELADRLMVGKNGEFVAEMVMPYGARTSQISTMANKAGIATATAEGIPTDRQTLNIINKYASPHSKGLYSSLEEVPLQVAGEAFAKKFGKTTEDLYPGLFKGPITAISAEDATKIPRHKLPDPISERIGAYAKRMLSDFTAGFGPTNYVPTARAGTELGETVVRAGTTNIQWYRDLPESLQKRDRIEKALQKIIEDAGKDKGANVQRMKEIIMDSISYGDDLGNPPDLAVLKWMGAPESTMDEALLEFNRITGKNYTIDEALEASGYAADAIPYERVVPSRPLDATPTIGRALFEQAEGITEMKRFIAHDIAKNFGSTAPAGTAERQVFNNVKRELQQRVAQTRLVSSRVAKAERDFTLLNYSEKTYGDLAMAYLYPFHFWYKGSYKNWLQRVATNPAVLGQYARSKDTLAAVHADMPDWWKYNINSNDLPGVDMKNPLYFNLEATLWPLNGLTNVDFNDPAKRVNAWTYGLDFANRFGPSTWSPINMITGLFLHQKGETEAGDRWMGRLIPQSASIKAAASLLGATNFETDPFISFLQGGLDPYERRRVSRALGAMEQEGLYTEEQLIDAAYSQSGAVWDEAVKRSIQGRAPSQLQSFLFGTGFKGRTEQDMEIDRFYGDYNRLWQMNPSMSKQEFKEAMDGLRDKYPFMDTVLLSRRSGFERDRGLAYNVMSRIPPAHTDDISKAAGIDPALMQLFYDSKGRLDMWSTSDYNHFMGGIIDIAAILEVPDDMTRKEWTAASNAYTSMTQRGEEVFGAGIWDMVDDYFAMKSVDYDKADQYLTEHPMVEDVLDWKALQVMSSPLLNSYYGGASVLEGYMKGQMYGEIEDTLGSDIFDIIGEYANIKTYGTDQERRDFYKQYKKDINSYYDLKDKWQPIINRRVAQFGANIPDIQNAQIRPDANTATVGGKALEQSLQPQPIRTIQEWQSIMTPEVFQATINYFTQDKPLSEAAMYRLDRLQKDLDYYDTNELLQQFGQSLYQGIPTQ